MRLEPLSVSPILRQEEHHYRRLMKAHHYLGTRPKIGETLMYVATNETQWVALLSFSAAALKCAARDRGIRLGLPSPNRALEVAHQ